MDQDLIVYLDRQFADLREENRRRFEQIDSRFERLEEEVRHGRVEVEGLRGQIQLLAECIVSFDQRLELFKGEVRRELETARGQIRPLYEALQSRVRTLESWRETKERDPIEIIKERFGLKDRRGLKSQRDPVDVIRERFGLVKDPSSSPG
jgi:chromosome segregation ATPase